MLDACISLCAESNYCCTCLQPIVESCCTCLQPIVCRIRIMRHPIIQCMHYGMSFNTCTWTRKSCLFFVCRIESCCTCLQPTVESCCTWLQPIVFRIRVMQHPIIQCMHYGMSFNTCTCSLKSCLFVCRIETISWFCNHPLGLGVLFCVQDQEHATHMKTCVAIGNPQYTQWALAPRSSEHSINMSFGSLPVIPLWF